MKPSTFILAVAMSAALQLCARLTPAALFNDNMVLQREKPVAVWGRADAGDTVSVSFGDAVAKATAGADGAWRTTLPAMPACRTGRKLVVATDKGERAEYFNVVVGEVWLCSGQSNMNMAMWAKPSVGTHGNRETNGYLDCMMVDEPDVRCVKVPNAWSAEPKDIPRQKWEPFAPGKLRMFSAIAFHYALILHHTLKVPVGVIQSAWGGACIEPWISREGFESEPNLKAYATRPIDTAPPAVDKTAKMPVRDSRHQQARAMYNAMIHPLAPYALRGALWYQGEANRRNGHAYAERLRALHYGWSKAFECPDMPFYLVQIAPFGYMGPNADPTVDCEIWEAEAEFARTQKNCGMAVIVDVGEIDNIHPGDKRTVAMRLAALALNRTYGRKDVPCDSPVLRDWKVEGDAFTLTFDHCKAWVKHGNEPARFEVAGADGKFVPATTTLKNGADGAIAIVRAPGVAEPKELRYLWSWRLLGHLKNEVGLPLAPFRIRK